MSKLLLLLAAPVGYLALSAYLFHRVRPLPITDVPDARSNERARALAA
jgi:hypothetical protein